jgi:hypothetical protein
MGKPVFISSAIRVAVGIAHADYFLARYGRQGLQSGSSGCCMKSMSHEFLSARRRCVNKKRWSSGGLALLVGVVAFSAPAAESSPIAAALQPFVERHELAGAVTLVASRDKVLDLRAVGEADIAAGKAMETGDLFWSFKTSAARRSNESRKEERGHTHMAFGSQPFSSDAGNRFDTLISWRMSLQRKSAAK